LLNKVYNEINIIFNIIYKWEETFNKAGSALGIECPDTNNCYIFSAFGSPYALHKSSDQGKTWNLVLEGEVSIYIPKSISVTDSGNIFLNFDKGKFLKSDNGGKSFTSIILDSVKSFETIRMYNKDIGVFMNTYIIPKLYHIIITHDGWKNYEKFSLLKEFKYASYTNPVFINNTTLTSLVFDVEKMPIRVFFLNLNIKSLEYKLNYIDKLDGNIADLCLVNDKIIFVCGKSNKFDGGSGNDVIYKSTNGGKNWRRVLDLYYHNKLDTNSRTPFGLHQIAFKDSLIGIAVGQFGKILYTYDGGESWIYENDLPTSISGTATMKVRYAGSIPLIATFEGSFLRMTEDNLAPKPEDTYSISGRVWEGSKGQQGIPVALGYRVTMTDSNGYYRFTQLKKGTYTVKSLNKYFDGANPLYYYKPFEYTPLQYNI
jgi:photosystem II stability/assembly factor-like uncharacterized protein